MKGRDLTAKAKRVQEEFLKTLLIPERKTKTPVMVALIGVVGSGKSSVAAELASKIGAVVVEGDAIRVALRKAHLHYESTRQIAENAALYAIESDGNAILDSDFITPIKRKELQNVAKKTGARLLFIRVYADLDVMVGRIITAGYQEVPDDFFGGATSAWAGPKKGAVVKFREMFRRFPHHYRWDKTGGGKWALKKLPFKTFTEIDTTKLEYWKAEVQDIAQKILKF